MATPQSYLTPLQELNKEFHLQYTEARKKIWQLATESGSVIIGKGSSLTLVHKGTHYPVQKAIPQVYHDLKSFAHIPLTTYFLLNNKSSEDEMKQYQQRLINVEVPNSVKWNERSSIKRIITASQILLQREMNNRGSVDGNELTQYCRNLTVDINVLLNAAATAQLDSMHDIVKAWFNEHGINPKSQLKILLIGPRAARKDNLQTMYFERLLGVERQRNIAYIEELFDNQEKAQSIFSSWFLDEELSVTIFDDQDRMHHDLLMNDHVRHHIEQLMK